MSVPNQTPYIIYNANGLTTVFPFEFYIINSGDIQVTINGTVITSGYTVSGVGNIGGGDVIFITPPASGSVVMLERVVPTYRLTDYQDNGDLLADTVNKDFDRLWMSIQRYGIHLGLALRRPLFGGPFDAEGYRIEKLADPVSRLGDEECALLVEVFHHPDPVVPGHVGNRLAHLLHGFLQQGVQKLVHVVDEEFLFLLPLAVGNEGPDGLVGDHEVRDVEVYAQAPDDLSFAVADIHGR